MPSDRGPRNKIGSNLGPDDAEHHLRPWYKTQNGAKRFNRLEHQNCFGNRPRRGRKRDRVILTGMGNDGALGLLEMKKKGAYNIAQDESTSVVFGMPREAIQAGAVDEVVALPQIASVILRHVPVQTADLQVMRANG